MKKAHICTPEEYFVDDWGVAGTRSVANLGENNEGHLKYEVIVKNAVVTDPDGETIEWNSTRTRAWVEGRNTGFFTSNGNGGFMGWDGILDDVYEITGTASGTNRQGIDFEINIIDQLRAQLNCRWITQGIIEIVPEGYDARRMDYGTGECDDKATLTLRNQEREVNLRR